MKQTKKIEVQPNLTLQVTSENIPVFLRGREEQTVELSLEMESSQAAENELTIDDIVTIDYQEEQNILHIKVSDPRKLHNYRARIDLEIPRLCTMQVHATNGCIKANDLEGEENFTTENGSIKLNSIQGKIKCQTENGSVVQENCRAEVTIETENGSVKSNDCEGAMNVSTENGSLKLKHCSGTLNAKTENGTTRIIDAGFSQAIITTQNGGIYYEFTSLEKGQFNFENDNGRIQLVIPDDLDYNIKARNKMGKFYVSLPGEYERKQTGDNHVLELLKGSGSVKINAQNEFGSINLVNQMGGKSFEVNLEKLDQVFDNIFDKIPEQANINIDKIKDKLEQTKEKIKHLKMPDTEKIQKNIDKAMNEMNKELKKIEFNIDIEAIKEKADEAFSSVVNVVKDKFVSSEMNENEKQEVNERSRKKILQMLQEGKITVDEAEQLLKAMEE